MRLRDYNDGDCDYYWPADETCTDATGETESPTCPLVYPEAPTEEDIARCYAPIVYLHKKEK